MIHKISEFFGRFISKSELESLSAEQIGELTRDMRINADDLYRLERSGVRQTLMPERLMKEGLSPKVIQAEWPSMWKDLQRVCTLCDSKDVCRKELRSAQDDVSWQRYCPNEGTIRSLSGS